MIREKIEEIDKERREQRKQRQINEYKVAIVGYTNSGKSTLLNRLTKAQVYAENQLFATLDTTSRRLWLSDETRGMNVIITDTVGFIREIPHLLIESFKSTLEDTVQSDMLVHILDASAPDYLDRKLVVEKTIEEIGAVEVPSLLCFNKIDCLTEKELLDLRLAFPQALFISASENLHIDILKDSIKTSAFTKMKTFENTDQT